MLLPVVQSVLAPVLRSPLDAGIMRGIAPPVGFGWAPPIQVYRNGSTFTTSFNPEAWKPATTLEIWVSPAGNDTTGNGTEALPYRNPRKAFQVANDAADTGSHIRILPGVYDRNRIPGTVRPDKDLLVTAEGGEVVFSARYEALSWSVYSGTAYQATRSAVLSVWDAAWLDSNGALRPLIAAVDAPTCAATPGTYFANGTTVYVNTFDGRSPDSNVLVMANTYNCNFDGNHRWYFQGIGLEGGLNAPFAGSSSATIGANASVILDRCPLRCGETVGCLQIASVPLTILYQCTAYSSRADGFNYHYTSQTGRAIEIDCRAYSCGLSTTTNSNGSTIHEDGKILRVNGEYEQTWGPVVADINTTQSWNLGCTASDSMLSSTDSDSAFRAQDSAQMWLDTCTAAGCTYATSVNGTAQIFYRSLTYDGILSGATPY
jgi:hypothetical protein